MAVGLGGLALVVLARTGGDAREEAVTIENPSDPADVVVEDGLAAPEASTQLSDQLRSVVGERSIRLLDFGEISQTPEVCAEGMSEGEAANPPEVIEVTQGRSDVIDETTLSRLQIDNAVAYGDITANGIDDAVVHAVCEFGANGRQHTLQVWDLSSGTAEVVATVPQPPAEATGPLPPDVKEFGIVDDQLEVVWTSYTDDDPYCCPSQETTIHYRVEAGEVVQVGEPETVEAS